MNIHLSEHDPEWILTYQSLSQELKQLLSEFNPKIEHIGSTAIPGLIAKPVIDILIGVEDFATIEACIAKLIKDNFVYCEKVNRLIPYRRSLIKLKVPMEHLPLGTVLRIDEISQEISSLKLAHIHLLEYNSIYWKMHIAFRDYLSEHKEMREEYEKFKRHLATMDFRNLDEYNSYKNIFIKGIEKKALDWFNSLEQTAR